MGIIACEIVINRLDSLLLVEVSELRSHCSKTFISGF